MFIPGHIYPGAFNARSRLSRWPAKLASPQQVHMQMENRLPRRTSVVDHGAVTAGDAALAGILRGDKLHAAEHSGVLGGSLVERCKMPPRANQDMRGCLGRQVFK